MILSYYRCSEKFKEVLRTVSWQIAQAGSFTTEGWAPLGWDIQNLFRSHARGIANSLRRRGLNNETAADLTQDTFVRVLTTPPPAASGNFNPKAYLYKISRNLGTNYQKREALITTVAIDDASVPEIADQKPSPEDVVHSRQCLLQTYNALAELPERTRQAFEMHRLGERTIAEIGEELGISTSRAWALIRDAYKHILSRVDAF